MKNTILTMASFASFAGAVNAQTTLYGYDAGIQGSGVSRLFSYASANDFATNSSATLAGTAAFDNFDGIATDGTTWYGYDAGVQGSGAGRLFSYTSVADFTTNSNATLVGSTAFDNFEGIATDGTSWYGYDAGIQGSGVSRLFRYVSISDFATNSNAVLVGTAAFDNFDGIATDGTTWYGYDAGIQGSGAGRLFSYASIADFTTNSNATLVGSTAFDNFEGIAAAPVPEPTSTALLGLSALGLLVRRKR